MVFPPPSGNRALNGSMNNDDTQTDGVPETAPVDVAEDDAGADSLDKLFCEYPPPHEPTTEFERKYPSDRFGNEVTDNARVWKIYRDEAMDEDRALLNGWHKTLDILLIFAGLFSAVSTAFIIESYKLLQPDYTQYIALALHTTITAQNGSGSFNFSGIKLEMPSALQTNSTSRWINGLWFVSLGLSLSVALLCILAKQWLEEYHTRTSAASRSPRHWSRRHVQYKDGLIQWHVPAVISVLPAVLHASLFLFLAGLYVFLSSLDVAIAAALLAVAAPLLAFYLASILVPMFAPHCPWSTTLVGQILRLFRFTKRQFFSFMLLVAKQLDRFLTSSAYCNLTGWPRIKAFTPSKSSLHSSGVPPLMTASEASLPLSATEGKAIEWLITTSPSSDVVSIAVQAIGSLHPYGDTVSFLCSSRAAEIALSVSVRLLNASLFEENNVDPITHARMRRVGLCLSELEFDINWRHVQNIYDLPVLSGLRRAPGFQRSSPVPRQFDMRPHPPSAAAYIKEIGACMKRAACSSTLSDSPRHPYLPSTTLLLLLRIPSVPLLVHAFHTYRHIWSREPLSIELVVQCAQHALSLSGITPSNSGSCRGCIFGQLELWCQILSLAETWSLDADDIAILQEDIRWFARTKQWLPYDCPAGFKHTLTHFSFALDICASKAHPVPDVAISVLGTALQLPDDARPSSPEGVELWYPSAARILVNISQVWWNHHAVVQADAGSIPSLELIVEDNPLSVLFDAVCHSGYMDFESASTGHPHPRCLWQSETPSPCNWDYSAAWDNPTCFLRPWDGLPSAWRILHAVETNLLDLLRLSDVLAAQLCSMRRSGHDVSTAVADYFIFDSCLDYLHRFCLDACASVSDSESSALFSGLDAVFSKRPMLLRFMQHCIELRGQQWWTDGFATFHQSSQEAVINAMVNSGGDNIRPPQEVAQIVARYRAFVAELDIELRRRGRCTQCPGPAIESEDAARHPPSRDVESQSRGWRFWRR